MTKGAVAWSLYDAALEGDNAAGDAMGSDGCVTVPTGPGPGSDIVWDYVAEHRNADAGLAVVYP